MCSTLRANGQVKQNNDIADKHVVFLEYIFTFALRSHYINLSKSVLIYETITLMCRRYHNRNITLEITDQCCCWLYRLMKFYLNKYNI